MNTLVLVCGALLAGGLLAGCGDDGPSCSERGGHVVQDEPILWMRPQWVGQVVVMIPTYISQSHCEIPR